MSGGAAAAADPVWATMPVGARPRVLHCAGRARFRGTHETCGGLDVRACGSTSHWLPLASVRLSRKSGCLPGGLILTAARIRPLLRQFATGAGARPGAARGLWPPRRAAPGDPVRDLIVVGTDGSEHAAAAVEAAVALAAAWDATVDVVGVHRFLLPAHPEVTPAVRAAAQTLRAGACPCARTCAAATRRSSSPGSPGSPPRTRG